MEHEHIELPAPQADERTFAMLAHLLQLFSWFVAPLIIFVAKRDSRFVVFHAIQALLWQVIFIGLTFLGMVAWFVTIFATVMVDNGSASPGRFPLPIVVVLPFVMLLWGGGWLTTMVLAIVYGIKASHGEWAEYPIVGRWARKLAKG